MALDDCAAHLGRHPFTDHHRGQDEQKALETAGLIAEVRHAQIWRDARLGKNDRSATGFLPPQEFQAAADTFFASPDARYRDWERAIDAQKRIVATVREIVAGHRQDDLMIVSHGAVGTPL